MVELLVFNMKQPRPAQEIPRDVFNHGVLQSLHLSQKLTHRLDDL
jgi:hypothetical protein